MTVTLLNHMTHVGYLPPNDGLLSGFLCQQRGIHLLANSNSLAGPVIILRDGRLPLKTAAIISLKFFACKHPSYANYMQL